MKIKIDYIKAKSRIAFKFAVKWPSLKKISVNYQKKGTPSAKHIWQSPFLQRFYTISKLQA